MKVIYAVRDQEPDILNWPLDDRGRQSFKLDRLAPANGFTHHDAHDALGDVEATIHIATIIRDRAPSVWEQCLRNRDRNEIKQLLQTGQPVRFIERYGAAPPRSWFGVYAGTNPKNRNSMAFLDLDLCDASIIDADDQEIAKAVSASPKRIRSIAINKVPNIFPISKPSDEYSALAQLITSQPDFQGRVGQAMAGRFADREEPEHVEQQIYSGFYSSADKQVLEEFKSSDWQRRADLVEQLEDQRLKQLGRRLVFWYAPEFASAAYQSSAQAAIRERWLSNEANLPWTTKADAELQLVEIEADEVMEKDRLRELREFYERRVLASGKFSKI